MAKAQTFGEKVAKAQSKQQAICPQCGVPLSYVKMITPTLTSSGSYSFRARMQKVCKCSNPDSQGK